VQARATAQDDFDAADRAVNTSLLKMKILGVKVTQIIDGHLGGDEAFGDDLGDVYAISPRSEGTILARARTLYPVWVRANTALAAMSPPVDPVTGPFKARRKRRRCSRRCSMVTPAWCKRATTRRRL